jgi:predicted nucleic acid-binding protein
MGRRCWRDEAASLSTLTWQRKSTECERSAMRRSGERPAVVLDASLAMSAIFPPSPAPEALKRLVEWQDAGTRLIAPALWLAECLSAIRRRVYRETISQEEAYEAIAAVLALEVDMQPMGPELCRSALDWAGRLGQVRAYDACYVALAEELETELWTADGGLAQGARQAGAGWVRLVQDR